MKSLFLEIGNTSINYAFTQEKKIILKDKIFLPGYSHIESIVEKFLPQNVIIASVVPEVESELWRKLNHKPGIRVIRMGREIKIPIKNRYLHPHTVGIDRLLNAYYITEKFSPPALCIDLGTAITIDVISPRGEFCGGLIFPGVKLCYDVLGEKTSLLPLLKPQSHIFKKLYGQTTEECIQLGIIKGISNLLEGVINNLSRTLEKKYNKKLDVFITGGDVTFFISITKKNKWKNIPELTLKSMILLWTKLCEK